jgi:hypothetical protein
MGFATTLAAIVAGLLVAIVLVNASVEWSRAVWTMVRTHRDEPWITTLRQAATISIRNRGPWVLAAVIVIFAFLPREPWAIGFLAACTAWIAFALATFLLGVGASSLYSAFKRKRADQRKEDDAA